MRSPARFLKILTVSALALAAVSIVSSVRANINSSAPLGNLVNWTVFSLGGGVEADDLSGTSDIYGNVGVAGNGNITMSGNATIHGDLWYRTPGQFKKTGNAAVTGATYNDAAHDSQLDAGVTNAVNASNLAASYAASTAYASMTKIDLNDHKNITLFAQHDRPGNSTVLSLTTFKLSGSSTLTLDGGGDANANFIINVSKDFSLTGGSSIVLTGGTSWDDVLFNVRGNGTDVQISGSSYLRGILMANQRTVKLTGSTVSGGRVIANRIVLSGGAQVISP